MAELQLRQEVLAASRRNYSPFKSLPELELLDPRQGGGAPAPPRSTCGTEAYLFPFKSLPELELLDPRSGWRSSSSARKYLRHRSVTIPRSNHSRSWSSGTRGQGGGAPAPPGSTAAPKRTYSPSNHSRSWSSWTRGRVAELQLRPEALAAPKRTYSPFKSFPELELLDPRSGWRSSSSARKYCGTEAYLFPFKSLPELELRDPR